MSGLCLNSSVPGICNGLSSESAGHLDKQWSTPPANPGCVSPYSTPCLPSSIHTDYVLSHEWLLAPARGWSSVLYVGQAVMTTSP